MDKHKKVKKSIFKSFYVKVTLSFMLSLLLVALLGNFALLNFSLKSQFSQLRDKLKVIAQTSVLSINTSELSSIPLNPDGINTPAFKNLASQLLRIKQANPVIRYIYIMAKTGEPGVYQFVVDPDALTGKISKASTTSLPGVKYDARRFPEMLKAFDGPSSDRELTTDEWGKTLSGYAPIFDRDNRAVAILGIDIDANDVYLTERALLRRGFFILLTGVLFSLLLGAVLSVRIISPVKKLIEGTRHIAGGDLEYKVKISSGDEIGQLAASFNNMASSLADARRKLQDYFYRMIQAMIRSLEAKDPYTRGHSDRVGELSYAIA
ncbi:MAG: HAMP domain-containing protein, partial [Candidatus Omnitrophica bacterium]|nr:HAMP domain-containing protein [Candidatus Omnitrophota bacterium]